MLVFVLASGGEAHDVASILLALAAVLVGAKLAGELFERLRQPAVLGELLFGIGIGNLALVGGPSFVALAQNETFVVLSELGAVLLLFHVGLESTVADMMAVGARATWVATVGVVTPMILGFGVGHLLHPGQSWMVHAFLGSMLAATSVGITARVLKDANAVKEPFARIILGAAVIDDVMGLVVLAVISGVITAASSGQALGLGSFVLIVVRACVFLVGALAVGSFLSPRVFKKSLALRSAGVVQSLSLSFCFLLAYLAQLAGLAPIVGAFAAGLVLEEAHFEGHVERGERPLHESLEPLIALLVPVFFVRLGMLVDLHAFLSPAVLGFALLLTGAAIAGKLVCAFAVPKEVGPLAVGLGMMPRGEVGLIFAAFGARLFLNGQPVIDPNTYAAAVFMVITTTMLTPPLLLWAIRRGSGAPARA